MSDNKEGHVYVLYNPIYKTYGEIYKIGQAKNIFDRIKSYSTYYPEESEIKYSISHPYYKEIEKIVHLILKEYRLNNNREFFKCNLDIIKHTLDKVKGYTLEEISTVLNKDVNNILEGYNKEDIKEPINLSIENISKIFRENDKELYSLFFSKETSSIRSIVKIFIDKVCTNKEGTLLISCVDKTNHKYKYTDIYNKNVIVTSSSIWSLIKSSCDIKNMLRYMVDKEYYEKAIEKCREECDDINSLREYRMRYLSSEFEGVTAKFKNIILEYF